MEARARRTALLLVVAIATGCGAPGPARTQTPDAERTTATSTGIARPEPSASSATPGPVTTISDSVRLRHEGAWRALVRPGRSPLQDICLDPGQGGLYLPDTTDYRGVASGEHTEELGVYRRPGRAGAAIAQWRVQADRCGHRGGSDHVGNPMEWVVREVEVDGADEAWQAHLLMTVEGPDLGVLASFITVVRVGTAVYVQHDGDHASPAAVGARSRAGLTSVASYVPTLATFKEPR